MHDVNGQFIKLYKGLIYYQRIISNNLFKQIASKCCIGDFISILAIALVKQFHAKLMVKAYIICNGILNLLYFGLSYFFIDLYGLVGVVKAYALSYLVYLLLVITFILHYYKRQKVV